MFTLTRFFREKDSFGPLRPKQPEISKTGKNIGRLNCVSIMLPVMCAQMLSNCCVILYSTSIILVHDLFCFH